MANPLVSIIVCCHNRAHMLPTTLESVFRQNYNPVEIIVFDDGSTDETEILMSRYGDKITYHRQKNMGVTIARTNACRLAKGEYIAFVDDDDLIPVDRISILHHALVDYPEAIFATGDFEVIDARGKSSGQRWLPASNLNSSRILYRNGHEAVLWPKTAAAVHTTLFRKSDGKKIGWFDEEYRYAAEDKDFFARLGMLGPVIYVPEVVSYYRRGHTSLTSAHLDTKYDQLKLFNSHITRISDNDTFKQKLQQRILTTLFDIVKSRKLGTKIPQSECKLRISQAKKMLPLYSRVKLYLKVLLLRN